MTCYIPARGKSKYIEVLRAEHGHEPGHEQSQGKHVKGWSIVSKPFISLFYQFQAFSA